MLSEEKIMEVVREASRGSATRRDGSTSVRIARAIEAAVLAELAKQEPVAWMNPHGGVLQRVDTGLERETYTIPLYAHPAPVPEGMVMVPMEVIAKIEQWSRAYPTDVFPEPDFDKVHAALKEAGISIDTVSASNMRHVISKVWEMIAAAENEQK